MRHSEFAVQAVDLLIPLFWEDATIGTRRRIDARYLLFYQQGPQPCWSRDGRHVYKVGNWRLYSELIQGWGKVRILEALLGCGASEVVNEFPLGGSTPASHCLLLDRTDRTLWTAILPTAMEFLKYSRVTLQEEQAPGVEPSLECIFPGCTLGWIEKPPLTFRACPLCNQSGILYLKKITRKGEGRVLS